MGRHTQQSLLSFNLQLTVGLEHMPICTPFLDRWWVQALFCTGHNQKEDTGSIKRGKPRGMGRMTPLQLVHSHVLGMSV